MRTEAPTEVYLTPQQAGQYIGVTARTLIEWRRTGRGPEYVRLGNGPTGRVRYERAKLDAYMHSRTQTSTSAESAVFTDLRGFPC